MTEANSHPLTAALFGDDEIADLLSLDAELDAMLAFERALAEAEAELGLIPADAATAITAALRRFQPDIAALKSAMARDGVPVPELVRQMRAAVGDPHGRHLHFGATSQDVVDTGLMLRLDKVFSILAARLAQIGETFDGLGQSFGDNGLMAYTRMQAAIRIRASDRVAAWREPLARHEARLDALRTECRVVQFGGAAGTLDALGAQGPAVRAALAAKLSLKDVPQWHSQRDRIADIAHLLAGITGSLGKFGQDLALMAEIGDIAVAGGGTSSAMPHKQNPVSAEILVTLARFNAVQVSGLHHSLVHEQERSGSAWSLEWMLLPQMLVACGASMRHALDLGRRIVSIGRA